MKNQGWKTALIIIGIVVFIVGGSFLASSFSNKDTSYAKMPAIHKATREFVETEIPKEFQKEPTEITVDQYLELKKGSETSLIYIARPTCHYCELQGPVLKNVAYEYDIVVNYLNTDNFDEAGHQAFLNSDPYFKRGFGTPLLLIVKEDEIVSVASGLHGKEDLVDFLKQYQIIQ